MKLKFLLSFIFLVSVLFMIQSLAGNKLIAQTEIKIRREKPNIEGRWEYNREVRCSTVTGNCLNITYSGLHTEFQFLKTGNFNVVHNRRLINYGSWRIKKDNTLILRYRQNKYTDEKINPQYLPDSSKLEIFADSVLMVRAMYKMENHQVFFNRIQFSVRSIIK